MLDKAYVILRVQGTDRFVHIITGSMDEANAHVAQGFEYTHWCIEYAGEFPKISDTPWIDSRTWDQKRRCGYIMDSDPLYFRYQGQKDADNVASPVERQDWLDARDLIKTKYPKP